MSVFAGSKGKPAPRPVGNPPTRNRQGETEKENRMDVVGAGSKGKKPPRPGK